MSAVSTPAYAGPSRVFSGMQPTGGLHLGSYLGALAQDGTWKVGAALGKRLLRLGVATAAMAAVVGVLAFFYPTLAQVFFWKEAAIVIACLVGAAVYGMAVLATGAVTIKEMRAALRREPGPASGPDSGRGGGGLPGGLDG